MIQLHKSSLRAVSFLLIPPLPNQVRARLLPICHSNLKICGRNPVVLPVRWNLGRIFEHYYLFTKRNLNDKPEMSGRNDCHFRLQVMLPSSFFCQPFHAVPREMGAHISMFFIGCICCFADPSCFVCWSWLSLFFFLCFAIKWQQKL